MLGFDLMSVVYGLLLINLFIIYQTLQRFMENFELYQGLEPEFKLLKYKKVFFIIIKKIIKYDTLIVGFLVIYYILDNF
jgi:hypothetical protein